MKRGELTLEIHPYRTRVGNIRWEYYITLDGYGVGWGRGFESFKPAVTAASDKINALVSEQGGHERAGDK